MSAFIIVDTKINNPEAYEEYKALARPIAENMAGFIELVVVPWICNKMSFGRQPGLLLSNFLQWMMRELL